MLKLKLKLKLQIVPVFLLLTTLPNSVLACQPFCNNIFPYVGLSACPKLNLTPAECQRICVCDVFGGFTCGSDTTGCTKRDIETRCGDWAEMGGRCDCSICWASNQGSITTTDGFFSKVRRGPETSQEIEAVATLDGFVTALRKPRETSISERAVSERC